MGNSKLLDGLSSEQYTALTQKLWSIQNHKCFICGEDIDLDLNPTNIDHIKPYPPQSIINYFKLQQQQKKGEANFNIEKIWYRTSPKQFENISTWHLLYGIKILRKPINSFINVINKLFKKLWIRYRWPSTRPNGYVLILKIQS